MGGKTTPPIPPIESQWKIDQVAETFGVTRTYLYDRRHRGQAPGSLARRLGRELVWDPGELARWWAEGANPNWTPNGNDDKA